MFVTLRLARDRDTARAIHRNDLKDISFMSVAVPYANIIVAERYWGHQVRATGLAAKYGTEVITDATELSAWLKKLGASNYPAQRCGSRCSIQNCAVPAAPVGLSCASWSRQNGQANENSHRRQDRNRS